MGNGESRSGSLNGCVSLASRQLSMQVQSKNSFDADRMSKLKIKSVASRESVEERLERYMRDFTVSPEKLRAIMDAFVDELHRGLELWRDASARGHPIDPKDCSFKMLDSCVKDLPSGEEKGVYYAIDFGGTNFRAVRLHLQGNGKIDYCQYKTSLTSPENSPHPKGLMDKNASATELFDFFAKSMKTFMKEQGDVHEDESGEKHYGVGFTFSFPCSLRKLDSANLMVWTKHFETGRATNDKVEGCDVAELLDMAFKRNNVPIKVAAVMNDTVGTLLSCAYEKDRETPPCLVGVILGTGMNACYYDEECPYYNYQGNIINLECGNFNRELPRTNVDMECDFHSTSNRGQQLTEKMVSGAYIGEICRRTMVKVYQHQMPEGAWQIHSFPAEDASQMAGDSSANAIVTKKIISNRYGSEMTDEQCIGIRRICYAVFDRSAALAAVIIAACAKKTGKLQAAMGGLTVGVDGSLYKCNKFYRHRVRDHLNDILGKEHSSLIHLALADDGSGKGAGVVASTIQI